MASLAQRWRRLTGQIGWLNTALYAANRLIQAIHPNFSLHRYYLVAQPVEQARLIPEHRGRQITVRRIGVRDPVLGSFNRSEEEIRARYENDAICFAAFHNGKMAGHLWLQQRPYQEPHDRCIMTPLPEGKAAWDFDLYIDPSERLGSTFAKLWDAANAELRNKGIQWTLSRISAFNPGAMLSHKRLGARFLCSTVFVTIGSCQILIAGQRPFLHFSWNERDAPVIRVSAPAMSFHEAVRSPD